MANANEISDIKIIKGEIESIKGHIVIFKGYGKTLDSIESALIGSSLNGHDGLVYKVDRIAKKVDEFEEFKIKTNNELTLAKWIFGIFFIAVVGSYVRNNIEDKKEKQTHSQTYTK
jgi:hypothetical protein